MLTTFYLLVALGLALLGCSAPERTAPANTTDTKRARLGESPADRRVMTTMSMIGQGIEDVGRECFVAHPLPAAAGGGRPHGIAAGARFNVEGRLESVTA